MAPRGGEAQPALLGEADRSGPKLRERLLRLGRGLAGLGVQLERGGEELTLEQPGEPRAFGGRDQLGSPRREQQRLRVEHHQLLLHTDRERRRLPEVRLDHPKSLSTISETNPNRRRSRALPGGRLTNPKNDRTPQATGGS